MNNDEMRSIEEPERFVARQVAQYDALENVAEIFGKWDQSTGPDGAHYVAESPFSAEGLVCANCAFYEGPRGCEIVSGDIDPAAVCKMWIIPEDLISNAGARSAMTHTDSEIRFDAPRDNLVRHVEFRAEPSADGLTMEGYAAVFNQDTQIEASDGVFTERIAPGAFRKTLQERMPVLQFDHGTHPLIGSIPLGVITSLREDEHGLRVKARLSDNWLVEPVRDAIRDGAIDGMSFRFRVINDKWTRSADAGLSRTITEIALYEVGPVVFPAYEQTSVGVRSREIITALNNPELRAELARVLTTGTSLDGLAATDICDESNDVHSTRSINQRRALARLFLGEN